MRLLSLLPFICFHGPLSWAATANADPPLQTTHLFYRNVVPLQNDKEASPFSPLATLTYTPSSPHNARVVSLTPPPNNTEYTSVALSDPGSSQPSRSTVTTTRGFHAPYTGRFRLMLSADGLNALSASYQAFLPPEPSNAQKRKDGKKVDGANERGDFDIAWQARAPAIHLDKPGKKGQKSIGISMPNAENEEGEQVEEKSFLQKYWWLLVAALVISLIGPGEK